MKKKETLKQRQARTIKEHPDFGLANTECKDCKDNPKWLISQYGYLEQKQFCYRHFFFFVKEYEKWYLEDMPIKLL